MMLVLVRSGFVLAQFPVVKGAVLPCKNLDRKCHHAIIIFFSLYLEELEKATHI